MDKQRWERIKQILNGCRGLEDAERNAYLIVACSGQPGLKEDVIRFLEVEAEMGDFLEKPVTGPAWEVTFPVPKDEDA